MNTPDETMHYQNVTNNERTCRILISFGMLLTVITGAVASPAIIFGVSMISIYLVMTAIIGTVPVYTPSNQIIKS